jgi:poly-gamma-glutamate synthesis protein (capsule biosynthesis protein)
MGAGSGPVAGEPDPRVDDVAGAKPADGTPLATSSATTPPAGTPADGFTIAFAGDVNFAARTADRLATDPATAFGVAAAGLAAADLTVVNLETAITTGGDPEPKQFTFRAPPSALTALADAGIDVASMANNHGADYGRTGLDDTVAAIGKSGLPVIGVGANETQAMAPFRTTIHGAEVAIFAATAVHDHTLQSWTATADRPGVASAFDPRLVANVTAAAARGETVIVFLHWGTEYVSCPDDDQLQLADELSGAGAAAVVGAHAHVLQGAGWRPDGTYVAYGLSNFLWWRSFGNEQDDNGVLTLTFHGKRVTNAGFAPSHLDDTGVPVPATGAQADRITTEWQRDRECTNLAADPPH